MSWKFASYLNSGLKKDLRNKVIMAMSDGIRHSGVEDFDAIAFTGLSGALVAPIVADLLGKELIAVRKEKTNHSSNQIEGYIAGKTYIILDDCRSSGKTIRSEEH